MFACMWYWRRPEESARSPYTGSWAIVSCHMSPGNWTWVLCKSSYLLLSTTSLNCCIWCVCHNTHTHAPPTAYLCRSGPRLSEPVLPFDLGIWGAIFSHTVCVANAVPVPPMYIVTQVIPLWQLFASVMIKGSLSWVRCWDTCWGLLGKGLLKGKFIWRIVLQAFFCWL